MLPVNEGTTESREPRVFPCSEPSHRSFARSFLRIVRRRAPCYRPPAWCRMPFVEGHYGWADIECPAGRKVARADGVVLRARFQKEPVGVSLAAPGLGRACLGRSSGTTAELQRAYWGRMMLPAHSRLRMSSIWSISRVHARMVSPNNSGRGVMVLSRIASTAMRNPVHRGSEPTPCSIC